MKKDLMIEMIKAENVQKLLAGYSLELYMLPIYLEWLNI
jgi:hypothetical protein